MVEINKFQKRLLGVAGIVGAVAGMALLIPTIIKENYIAASISGALIMIGIILLSISFSD